MTVPPLLRVWHRTLDLLDRERVPYAVMGGFAVRVWGIPRPTYDLDVVIALEEDGVARLLTAFEGDGFDVPPEFRTGFRDVVGGAPKLSVHRAEDGHLWDVDVFIASTDLLRSAMGRKRTALVEGRSVSVLASEDLILLKLVARRPKDVADVTDVLAVVGDVDREYLESWARRLDRSDLLADLWRAAGRE